VNTMRLHRIEHPYKDAKSLREFENFKGNRKGQSLYNALRAKGIRLGFPSIFTAKDIHNVQSRIYTDRVKSLLMRAEDQGLWPSPKIHPAYVPGK